MDKREWLTIDELHVIRAFLDAGVRFLIAGGRAVQFHGHFRPTKDLDLLVETSPEGGKRLTAALKSLGTDVNPAQFGNLSEDRPARGVVCRYPVEFITAIRGGPLSRRLGRRCQDDECEWTRVSHSLETPPDFKQD